MTSAQKSKTAIIAMGGGMRSAHGAGFLYALGTNLGITSPDILIGTSGNAGNSLYYATGQYEYAKLAWTEYLTSPRFISFTRPWRVMDIDYLIDQIIKKDLPLDTTTLARTLIQYFIPLLDVHTGKCSYVDKHDTIDAFELLRAAKAMPVIFGKTVKLLGCEYCDGELGLTTTDHVAHAIAQGANRILVINNNTPITRFDTYKVSIYSLLLSKYVRRAMIRDVMNYASCVESEHARIMCVSPKKLPAQILTCDKQKLTETFKKRERDALSLKHELRALLL